MLFQSLPEPGEEIVPSKEPEVVPWTVSNRRSTVKPPVAPSNRPVPPVMTAISTIERTPGVPVGPDSYSITCRFLLDLYCANPVVRARLWPASHVIRRLTFHPHSNMPPLTRR